MDNRKQATVPGYRNFDEFRIYDFDVNINEPLDTIALPKFPLPVSRRSRRIP